MIKDCGQRFATADGVMLADPPGLGKLTADMPAFAGYDSVFDPGFWANRGELVDVSRGRGAAWFIGRAPYEGALRHYRRGGVMARFSMDRYVWTGERRVRSFAEWRLLATLVDLGLPVPHPVAARYRRRGLLYRCDLITRRIAAAEPLSAVLSRGALDQGAWREVGAIIARFHAAGVDHADLNAHNILLDGGGHVSLIDFDRCRLRSRGPWAAANLSRLRRSLVKISNVLPHGRFSRAVWNDLLAGYAG